MRQSRFNSVYQGLNAVSKKVYGAVPITAQWTLAQLNAELRRLGHTMDIRVIGGSLAGLVSTGLIVEIKKGHFTRVKVSEGHVKKADVADDVTVDQGKENSMAVVTTPTLQVPAEQQKQTAIVKLGALSERAVAIGLMLKTLADDITKIAVEIDDDSALRAAETSKFRQLQQLLKDIGG